jgi:hypothetical protein
MFPLVAAELGPTYPLADLLQFGSLPKITTITSLREKVSYLKAYSLTYIKEEVIAEQLLRKLDPFRQFLRIAADQRSMSRS